jgi:catechol 2,3-dioxygenase-like lactoylglutathione lyase family enzyme
MPPAAPSVECEELHPCLAVTDVGAAVQFYTEKLGFRLGFTWGDPMEMAGVNLGEMQIMLEPGPRGPRERAAFFNISDADALYAFHVESGVEIVYPIADRPWGFRNYTVRDPDGNTMVFGHRLPCDEPALEIERADVLVRLETRLAALVQDLAEHKRMSLSSCLEEILLHTCEPLGEGVASPHTKSDLRYIQELKAKHGIDYDCHASYRFIEKA